MWQNFTNCSASGGVSERNQSLRNATIHVEADWGDVVRKSDCSVLNPLDVDISFIVVLVFICAFGFPLNFEIVYRIVYDKVLRRQSRYVIQLFSTTSSLFTFFTIFVQICYFFFRRFDQASEHLCHVHVNSWRFVRNFFPEPFGVVDRFVRGNKFLELAQKESDATSCGFLFVRSQFGADRRHEMGLHQPKFAVSLRPSIPSRREP